MGFCALDNLDAFFCRKNAVPNQQYCPRQTSTLLKHLTPGKICRWLLCLISDFWLVSCRFLAGTALATSPAETCAKTVSQRIKETTQWASSLPNDPTTGILGDSIHPVIDTMEMRLRCELLREAQESVDPNTVVVKALEYAAEAEQRIAELNARVRTLESLAKTDELTGLLNRRGFYDIVRRELQTSARHKETGVLAYIDLDEFKPINDKYGHAAGDEVLRAVGRQLGTNIRATDYAARLGGDEFAVLFVRAEHIPARERARAMLEELNDLTVTWKRKKIQVRASMGLANYTGETAFEELLAQSDRAMYREKRKATEKRSATGAR